MTHRFMKEEGAQARAMLPGQIKTALGGSSLGSRAELLEEVVRVFYDWTKFQAPGGEGLDGRDGPERQALAPIVDLVIDHQGRMRNLAARER